MKSTSIALGLAALASSTAQADLLQTRNLRTRATQPAKKQESAFISELVEEDMKFWNRELGGSVRRKLKAADKEEKAVEDDKQFWARQLGSSARR